MKLIATSDNSAETAVRLTDEWMTQFDVPMRSIMFAHNTSVNKTTGLSPYKMVFKQQARRPETFFLPKDLASSGEEWTPEKVQRGCRRKSGTP